MWPGLVLSAIGAAAGCGVADEGPEAHPGPCQVELDWSVDGTIDMVWRYAYDEHGRTTVGEWDRGADGVAEERQTHRWLDDAVVEIEIDDAADGTVDAVRRIERDPDGRMVREEFDGDADGTIDGETARVWDAAGRLASVVVDAPLGGALELRETYTYRTGQVLIERDMDGDGAIDSRTVRLLDGRELAVRELWDHDADGQVDDEIGSAYDARGQLVRIDSDYGADGAVDEIRQLVRDADGHVALDQRDTDGDGTVDMQTRSWFDEGGNRLVDEVDSGADGVIDDRTLYDYGCFAPDE